MTKRYQRPRRVAALAALLLALTQAACKKEVSTITVPDTQLTQPGAYLTELEAVAAAPGSDKCPNGRAVISSWDHLFSLDLTTFEAKEITSSLPMPTAESQPGELYYVGGDPQFARLKDGSFLYLRQGFTSAPIPGTQPEWASSNGGQRGMLFIWRSTDCGENWEVFHPIDAQDVLKGECAYPQQSGPGGFDRSELYVDPWNENIYLGTTCRSGNASFPGHGIQRNLLFVKRPGDSGWRAPLDLPWNPPLALTSTKSGRLWIYHWLWHPPPSPGLLETFEPKLYLSETQGETVLDAGGLTLVFDDTAPADLVNQIALITKDKLAAGQKVQAAEYSVARSGDGEQVRLALPGLEDGRQVLRIAVLTRFPDRIAAKLVHTFEAEADDASIIHPAFIESDRVEDPGVSRPALLYWLESSPGSGKLQVRYSVAKSNLAWSEPKTVSAAPWSPKLRSDGWAGDYMNGAHYFHDGASHFLLTWAQSEPGVAVENLNIHYAVVRVEP